MKNKITSYFYEGENKNVVSLKHEETVSFLIHDDSNILLDINEFNENNNVSFIIGNNSKLTLRLLVVNNLDDLNIKVNVPRGSKFDMIVADFSDKVGKFNTLVSLEGEDSEASIHLATLSKEGNKKKFNLSFDHKVGKTKSLIDCYGVSKDSSLIKIDGISHIYENANKADAAQKVRVILFDKESEAIANPILKIDCNDIKAQHACAIGSLREEHLYYLLSRGIEINEARSLITLGYLLPIAQYFEEKDGEKIKEIIGGAF